MKSRKSLLSLIHTVCSLTFTLIPVKSLPFPKSFPEPDANPIPQFFPVQPHSHSSQQFTMYKPIQVGYGAVGSGGGGGLLRPDLPVFTYTYNISHPPRPYGRPIGGRSSSPAVLLDPHQVHHLRQEQQRRSGGLSQQGQPLQLQYQRQYQQNQIYAPVIIANPNLINTRPEQNQRQNFISTSRVRGGSSGSGQFYVEDYVSETDAESEGIGLRLNNRNENNARTRTNFDQRLPTSQQTLQYPENIFFSNNNGLQQGVQLPYNTQGGTTTRPPIHVPYVTTPNTLQKLQQLQKNPQQQSVSGFRSQLGLVNPQASTSLTQFGRNDVPSFRTGRVQNIVVPVSTAGQTPAGTRLLQQNIDSLSHLQNFVASNVYAHQRGQGQFLPRSSGSSSSLVDLSSPNLHILKGIAITPENQRDIGHLIFSDPHNPTLPQGAGNAAVLASTAQKVFILPQGDNLGATDSENPINFDEIPAEIVVTVVEEDDSPPNSSSASVKGERGKVISNFSLFLLPSSFKKCAEGYRRAHNGKCRLIIKLKGRNRVYSG